MDLDNKIFKYKIKKKNIYNKILQLLIEKNNTKNYIEQDNIIFEIIKTINIDLSNLNNQIFIIVVGFYSVGKSSFIEYFDSFVNKLFTKIKINIKNLNDIQIINNFNNHNLKNIIYIETSNDLIEKILNLIKDNKIFIFNLIPKNLLIYKNRLINNFFDNKLISSNINNCMQEIINNINYNNIIIENSFDFSKKNLFSDNDFIFLDKLIIESFKYVKLFELKNLTINKIYF